MLQNSRRRPLKYQKFSKRAKFVVFFKKVEVFNDKTWFLYKLLKVAKSKWNASEKKTSQNVHVLGFFETEMGFWSFFQFSKNWSM